MVDDRQFQALENQEKLGSQQNSNNLNIICYISTWM